MYQFDEGIERRGTNCVKWDVPFITEGVTPMWIADMDFRVAPAITENLRKIAEQGDEIRFNPACPRKNIAPMLEKLKEKFA